MQRDDRQTEDGGGGEQAASNVVRLPREWIGPIEELVPFGPSAGSRSSAATRDTDPDLMPPGADDFWGEDSAQLQHALQAPTAKAARSAGNERAHARRPRFPGSVAGARERARARARPDPPHRHRAGRAAAAVGVIAGLALIVTQIQSPTSPSPQKDRTRAAVTLPASIDAPRSTPPSGASKTRIAIRRVAHRSRSHRRIESHRAAKRTVPSTPRRSTPVQATVVASYSPPASTSAPIQTAPSPASAAAPSASTSADKPHAAHRSASPGPTGPVSLIGSGTSPSG